MSMSGGSYGSSSLRFGSESSLKGAQGSLRADDLPALYCINLRAEQLSTAPELAIRKLSTNDNLFVIENSNRLLTEFITKRNECISMDATMNDK